MRLSNMLYENAPEAAPPERQGAEYWRAEAERLGTLVTFQEGRIRELAEMLEEAREAMTSMEGGRQ